MRKKIKEELEYLVYFIKSRYLNIIGWFKYHFTKKFWKLILECFKSYPWDYGYLYRIEQAKLEEMLDYQVHSNIICEESKQENIRTLKLALRMLYIIQHETDFYHIEGDFKTKPIECDEHGNTLCQLDSSEVKYHCDCKVNTKNYYRFMISKHLAETNPHELYLAKALYLYHKIRYQYEECWWD